MSDLVLTKTSLRSGVWQGLLEGAETPPDIVALHLDKPVDGVVVSKGKDPSTWRVEVPIPVAAISDGVQTLMISDSTTKVVLDKVSILAGDALTDDLRAEVDALRSELDLLKRAFRQHCVDTAG